LYTSSQTDDFVDTDMESIILIRTLSVRSRIQEVGMESFVLYYPDDHQLHQFPGHPERPERVEAIKRGLKEIDLWDDVLKLEPHSVPENILTAVHNPDYLKTLEKASAAEEMLDMDTYTTRDSWKLAHNAAGGGLAVAEGVWSGEYLSGFGLTRPPGHHATISRGMGFCLINNIAVAAEYLIREKGAKRISIIDVDLHHGNGTQDIFWQRSDVSFISIHQAPFYPGTGAVTDIGEGDGKGTTLNLPIPSQSGDAAYQVLLEEIVTPFLDGFKPEILLISFGFDTHWRDPLGSLLLSGQAVYDAITYLNKWAKSFCEGRIAVFLEGGYDLEAGRISGQAVASALIGREWVDTIGPAPDKESEAWKTTLDAAKNIWKF
jgi:acetoin utilization deacetylase AcuC-like enzyme